MNINEAFNVLNLSQSSANQTEIKKAYKIASLKYHPDRNPAGAQIMKVINSAYEFLSNLGIDPVIIKDVSTANYYDFTEELSNILNELIFLNGLIIEVCGNWIWISGETKQHKEKLKGLRCFWSNSKKMWYFKPQEYKRRFSTDKNIEQIRETYGSKKVSTMPIYNVTA